MCVESIFHLIDVIDFYELLFSWEVICGICHWGLKSNYRLYVISKKFIMSYCYLFQTSPRAVLSFVIFQLKHMLEGKKKSYLKVNMLISSVKDSKLLLLFYFIYLFIYFLAWLSRRFNSVVHLHWDLMVPAFLKSRMWPWIGTKLFTEKMSFQINGLLL